MFSGPNGTRFHRTFGRNKQEAIFLNLWLNEQRIRRALEGRGVCVLCLPLHRHLPPNRHVLIYILLCENWWDAVIVPPPEMRCLPHAFLRWISTESRVLYAHVLRRPHCFCTQSTRSPSNHAPCIPWLFLCRAYCLYIAFLTRDATLRTILKSMQLHKAHLYDAFTPCHSFLKHRITFKGAFCSVHLGAFYSNARTRC